MIDGYQGNENQLDDIKAVNATLNEIVTELNLRSVMPPFLLPYYYAKEIEDDGISAFVLLVGGHITIHTFPKRGCLFVDLLYDGYFDGTKLRNILKSHFMFTVEKLVRTERRFYDTTIDDDKIWKGGDCVQDFGPHIIARIDNIKDVSFEKIFDMLDELPNKINMLPICRPYVLKSFSDEGYFYISGIVLIAQSHIAFHYSVTEQILFCDLFSCSFYKSDNFVNYLKENFGKLEYMTLIRGSKHELEITDNDTKRLQLSKWLSNVLGRK
jgi:S-adenosylmethionine/arginine decarboxylase-like enzyme